MFSPTAKVPLKPFCGTVGVALAEPGLHSIVPPRRVGGNLDIRDLSAGSVLYLPVEVEGALFSIGDGHAAQGDGEVGGTAIESPINVVLTLDVDRKLKLRTPCFTTPGPVTSHFDKKGYEVSTGVGARPHAGGARRGQPDDRHSRRASRALGDRRLHALLGLRRSSDQRDRRPAELGRLVLFSARGLRVKGENPSPPLRGRDGEGGRRGRGLTFPPPYPPPQGGRVAATPLLSVRNLTTEVATPEGSRVVVEDLSFDLAAGETLCIAGESGSGKSMTALSIMRLLPDNIARIAAGSISLAGRELTTLPESAMRRVRGGDIAMIFQEPMTSLNPVMSVGRQLIEAIRAHRPMRRRRSARDRASGACARFAFRMPERRLANIRTSFPAACASA